MSELTTLVIDRSKWLRGKGHAGSVLRDSSGLMCCLGFAGLACGIPEPVLLDHAEPAEVDGAWPAWMVTHDSDGAISSQAVTELIEINDERGIADADREARLAAEFAAHGVTVTFTDGEP